MDYHRTKDSIYVKFSTLQSDSKRTQIHQLIEAAFEYVVKMEGYKLFRKRK